MREDSKLEELSNIKWDIIRLAEIRRKEEERLQLNLGEKLYYKDNEESISNVRRFIINKIKT